MDLFTLGIVLLSGVGAGLITGLIGASAVLIMAPLLIILLDMNPYLAIGLSLATDIIASMVAAKVYYKNKNIKLKAIVPLLFFSFIGIIIGSYASFFVPSSNLAGVTGIAVFILGIVFMRDKKSKKLNFEIFKNLNSKKKLILLSLIGLFIGLISGTFGVGGGMMILAVLVLLLGFSMHMAIGTSIAMMVLMAFFGATTHYYYEPFPMIFFFVAAVGAYFGAKYSSIVANRLPEKKLRKIVGAILSLLGLLLTIKLIFF